jgi:heme-degrading monooxygenase HmoA
VIQTILLFTLRPGVTDEQVEALRAALATIPSEGRRNMRLGRDIGLLDGAMDLAIVTDYDDEDSYRRWFAHPEHARVRCQIRI